MNHESAPRLLIVEDDELHVELIRRALTGADRPVHVRACHTLGEARDRLAEETPDLVLVDLKLPDGSGTDLLPPEGVAPTFGVVLMTSHGNERTAVDALRRGAIDYLVKSESVFADMPAIAARALRTWALVSESRRIEERLRMTQFSLDHAADSVFWIREDGTFDYANESACRGLELSLDELRSRTVMEVNPEVTAARWKRTWERAAAQGSIAVLGACWRGRTGAVYADLTMTHMEFGRHRYLCVFAREATDRHKLEQQLRQAQKMEAIGRLAGGVAHDFNNHLFAINLFADLLARELSDNRALLSQVLEIKQAGEQAARLTQQLLAFSRQQVLKPEVLDLNAEIRRLHAMLRRIIGEDTTLRVDTGTAPAFARIDPTQIDQVVLNLVVNARDAMPRSGTIAIEVSRETVERPVPGVESDVLPGSYVTLTVSDTGSGMERDTLARIFDPFFTTKDKSKGTGLGLSMVLGVVKQSRGHIAVDSAPGRGSRFKIFFPEVFGPEAGESELPAPLRPRRGTETVLLVEDEQPVRRVLYTALCNAGYRVLEADCGAAAIELARRFDGTIHLLLTDVVMPGMNGVDLSRQIVAGRPATRALFMSGYADLEALGFETFAPGTFLQKPCPLENLLAHVRTLLDG